MASDNTYTEEGGTGSEDLTLDTGVIGANFSQSEEQLGQVGTEQTVESTPPASEESLSLSLPTIKAPAVPTLSAAANQFAANYPGVKPANIPVPSTPTNKLVPLVGVSGPLVTTNASADEMMAVYDQISSCKTDTDISIALNMDISVVRSCLKLLQDRGLIGTDGQLYCNIKAMRSLKFQLDKICSSCAGNTTP
jgi:hypothetical protein